MMKNPTMVIWGGKRKYLYCCHQVLPAVASWSSFSSCSLLSMCSDQNSSIQNGYNLEILIDKFHLKLDPHTCHDCCCFSIQQTLEIKSAYHDLNQAVHPSKPCALTTRLTHTASSLPHDLRGKEPQHDRHGVDA